MVSPDLVRRVERLEQEMIEVKQLLAKHMELPARKTSRDYIGMLHGDKDCLEAMEAGAAYRRSGRRRFGSTNQKNDSNRVEEMCHTFR